MVHHDVIFSIEHLGCREEGTVGSPFNVTPQVTHPTGGLTTVPGRRKSSMLLQIFWNIQNTQLGIPNRRRVCLENLWIALVLGPNALGNCCLFLVFFLKEAQKQKQMEAAVSSSSSSTVFTLCCVSGLICVPMRQGVLVSPNLSGRPSVHSR